MRKSQREIQSFEEITDVLYRCDTIRLGLFGQEYPYVVPLSFGHETANGKIVIYIHGAQEGKKHDLIAQSNKVCVEADICHGFVETERSVTTVYESIIGYGTAEKVYGDEMMHGLRLLLAHCGYEGFPFDQSVTNILTVYKITLDSVTGKRRTV